MKRKFRKLFLLLLAFILSLSMGMVADAASVKISKKSITLLVSRSTTLTISGTKQKAKWSSSNKKVAKVSSKGKVTAVKAGKATIKAKIGKKTYSCKVTVKAGLSETKVTLDKGKTKTLKLYGGKIKSVSTSNKKVATISKSGKITAKGKGTCTLTIKDKNGKKYTCKVTVCQKVTKVKLNKTSASLDTGNNLTLKATATPTNANNRKVKWTSSNTKVAKVSSSGVVTAVAPGTAVIKATAADGSKKSASCSITVKRPVSEIKLNKTSAELEVGGKVQLSGTVSPSDASNKALSWSTSDAAVATVSQGLVIAKKTGTAVITATTQDGTNQKAQCTVKVIRKASSISLSQTSLTLENGNTANLRATVSPADTTQAGVTWSSSNASVATVVNGAVTAKKAGTAVITATTTDGTNRSAKCTVTVIQKASSISLSQTSLSLEETQTASLRATVSPADTTQAGVTWSSSNTAVATVNNNGLVTAVKEGTAVISAATTDGTNRTASCQVTVRFNGNVTVSTQEQLNAVFARQDISSKLVSLTLQSNAAVSLTIPQGTYANARLTVNLPNGEVINKGTFQSCVIQAISGNTFIEQTTGNTLRFQAVSGRIQIDSGAAAVIEVGGASTVQQLSIVNNGILSALELDNRANVSVTGSETRNAIPVTGTAHAANSVITTSQRLKVTAQSKMSLVLNAGAENTTASVTNDSDVPSVSGLGSVTVTNTVTEQVDTIVAERDPSVDVRTVAMVGNVTIENSGPASGASVYLIPYSAAIDKDSISSYFSSGEKQTVDEDGNYSFADVALGNYYLAVAMDGYNTLVQTLVITSVTSDTYSNSTLCLVKSGGENGGISGVLTDALTGSKIDYAVVMNVRKGQNELSGAALRTITLSADDNGSYEITDLPAGTYTIQVLSAPGSDTVISGTSFNVTVLPGAVSNGNHTVTRELEEGQMRFVLTWGDSQSGAPSDLDSHLVGPAAAGTGRLHTWYSDKEYEYNGILYADLDVDDTTWEGPETTTIYKETGGIYSFYVFDYTDQSDEYSNRMSNQSKAEVKVYRDEILLTAFYIPTGESGNLWHVCDYNSNTGAVSAVNTVGYWPDGGSSTVGLSTLDVLRSRLDSIIGELEDKQDLLADGAYKAGLVQAIGAARVVCENATEEAALQTAIDSLREYRDDLDDMPYIESITGINVNWYETGRSRIDLYGTAESVGESLSVNASCEDSQVSAFYAPVTGEDYIGIVTAVKDSGLTRIWKVYYSFDIDMFEIQNVEGDGITDYEVEKYSSYGELYIRGRADTLPDFVLTLRDGVTYEVEADGDYSAVVIMEYEGHAYKYYVEYSFDSSVFAIQGVSGDQITDYDVSRYAIYGYLNLYGTSQTLPAFELSVGEGVTYEIGDDPDGEYGGIVTMTYGTHKFQYFIRYSFDVNDLFKIMGVSGHGVTDYRTDEDTLYVQGVPETLPELTLTVGQGVEYQVDVSGGMVSMSCGEYTYKYYVEYEQSTKIFEVLDVTGSGIYRFDSDRWNNTNMRGSIDVYGEAESIPDDIVLTVNNGVTYEMERETSEDSDYDALVTMEYLDYVYTYELFYSMRNPFKITGLEGDGILESYSEMTEDYGEIYLSGFAEELRITDIFTEKTGITWTVEEPESGAEYDAVVRMEQNGRSYVYYVYSRNTVEELELDTPFRVYIPEKRAVVYFRYTAAADGTYTFASSDEVGDPFVYVYTEAGEYIGDADDGDTDSNFRYVMNMKAGETYYFGARCFGNGTGEYTVILTSESQESAETEMAELLILNEEEPETEASYEAETEAAAETESAGLPESTESEPIELSAEEETELSEEGASETPGPAEESELAEVPAAEDVEADSEVISLLPEEGTTGENAGADVEEIGAAETEAEETEAEGTEPAETEVQMSVNDEGAESITIPDLDLGNGEIQSMEITLDLTGADNLTREETIPGFESTGEEDIIEEPMF